jgi:hypothetical protein
MASTFLECVGDVAGEVVREVLTVLFQPEMPDLFLFAASRMNEVLFHFFFPSTDQGRNMRNLSKLYDGSS